jgi:hypothetical protein
VKQKSDTIRKNWNESQFLSDYGSYDRPMSEVKASPQTLASGANPTTSKFTTTPEAYQNYNATSRLLRFEIRK